MRIIFTGASSLTGYHFVRELSAAGHEILMTFTRKLDEYDGVRSLRVERAARLGRSGVGVRFGDGRFMELLDDFGHVDLLCHHAAEVRDYKSADFDIPGALARNTNNLRKVLQALSEQGCRRVVLTGSVFEQAEGAGSGGRPSFSPYGLSKALTWEVFRYYGPDIGMHVGKFVIPNPFGPYEEPRFTTFLARSWLAGEVAVVKTPEYVRDNIHASLLARSYAQFIDGLPDSAGTSRINPSGYVESQGSFATRFAGAMRDRLGVPCQLQLQRQIEFGEPKIRINVDPVDGDALGWSESEAWDELASFYRQTVADAKRSPKTAGVMPS